MHRAVCSSCMQIVVYLRHSQTTARRKIQTLSLQFLSTSGSETSLVTASTLRELTAAIRSAFFWLLWSRCKDSENVSRCILKTCNYKLSLTISPNSLLQYETKVHTVVSNAPRANGLPQSVNNIMWTAAAGCEATADHPLYHIFSLILTLWFLLKQGVIAPCSRLLWPFNGIMNIKIKQRKRTRVLVQKKVHLCTQWNGMNKHSVATTSSAVIRNLQVLSAINAVKINFTNNTCDQLRNATY